MTISASGANLQAPIAILRSGQASVIDSQQPGIKSDDDYVFLDTDGLSGGGFITSWAFSADPDGAADGIAVQRIGPDGSAQGETLRIEGLRHLVDLASYDETVNGSIEALADGGYALAYTSRPERAWSGGPMTGTVPTAIGDFALYLQGIGKPLTYYVGGVPAGLQASPSTCSAQMQPD